MLGGSLRTTRLSISFALTSSLWLPSLSCLAFSASPSFGACAVTSFGFHSGAISRGWHAREARRPSATSLWTTSPQQVPPLPAAWRDSTLTMRVRRQCSGRLTHFPRPPASE